MTAAHPAPAPGRPIAAACLATALAFVLWLACATAQAAGAAAPTRPAASGAAASIPTDVPSTARTAVRLDDMTPDIDAETQMRVWIDERGKAGIEQAAASPGRFQPVEPRRIYQLGQDKNLWLHLRVVRDPSARNQWMLTIPLPMLDNATLFQRDAQGGWQSQSAGDTVAVSSWPEPGRYPAFKLNLPPGEVRDIFVCIRHTTSVNIPVQLVSEPSHYSQQSVDYLLLGVVFGALCLLIVGSGAQAWVHRDRIYGWYAAYSVVSALAAASYTGVAAHLLWPNSASWADTAQGVLALLAGSATLLFVRHLSGLSIRYPRVDRLVKGLGYAGPLLAFFYITANRPAGLQALGAYLLVATSANLWISALAWRRGDPVGRWMVAAYTPMAIAVSLILLRVAGVIPSVWLAQYGIVIAMAAQVPLLLVALNLRSRERHSAEIREQALASQDALTGLLAPHLFQDRLRQAISWFKRDHESSAVIVIDLVNYARIKAVHGQAVAEQSLLRCVIKLRRLLRDVDTVSRIGEARFGLIMEGVGSRAVVTDRCARLIASGLMPLKGLKPDVTLQFHSAAVLLNERLMAPHELLDALAQVLAEMSPRTRRPIRFVEPEETTPIPLEPDSQQDAEEDALSSLPRAN
jgi:diguanylate cyclase (GGDEF)-like protein